MARSHRIEEPGHAHELTFSCYHRLPLFDDDDFKLQFLESLDRARKKQNFKVWAYVIMPNHAHLLIHPNRKVYSLSNILRSIKQPVAQIALPVIADRTPQLIPRLTLPDGTRRFWQSGGGYLRNFFTPDAIHNAIDYIHANPVRAGLVETTVNWIWSSARWYADLSSNFEVDRCDVIRGL